MRGNKLIRHTWDKPNTNQQGKKKIYNLDYKYLIVNLHVNGNKLWRLKGCVPFRNKLTITFKFQYDS